MKPPKASPKPKRTQAATESYLGALIEMLKGIDFEHARDAAQALGEAGDTAAVKPLVAVVKASAALRATAIAALKKIAENNQAAAVELAMAVMEEREEKPAETIAGSLVLSDRRRSPRVFLAIPVLVRWADKRGEHAETTTTKVVNAYGALLLLRTPIELDQEITVTNTSTQAVAKARVVCLGAQSPEHGNEVGIELGMADPEFWVGHRA